MKFNKKHILITISLITFLLCCSVFLCMVQFNYLFSKQTQSIKKDVLLDICNSHGKITSEDFKKYFSVNYQNTNYLFETQSKLEKIFPQDYNCDNLLFSNIFPRIEYIRFKSKDLIKDKEAYIFFSHNGYDYTIKFIKENTKMTMD